jgi:hypothetical protein
MYPLHIQYNKKCTEQVCLVLFRRYSVRISAVTVAVFTDVRCFPPSFEADVGIVPRLGNDQFLSIFFVIISYPTLYSLHTESVVEIVYEKN